mgnify:CR=1 FL=1
MAKATMKKIEETMERTEEASILKLEWIRLLP